MRTTSDIGTAGRMRVKSDMKITEHEGMLLALMLRQQPVTAYQLFRFFETSPVTSINASKGQLYPAIRRLRERGLIAGRKVAGDGRGAEALSVTKAGEGAVRAWVQEIDGAHIYAHRRSPAPRRAPHPPQPSSPTALRRRGRRQRPCVPRSGRAPAIAGWPGTAAPCWH